MAMPRPRPPRSAAEQKALTARAEKGKRLLKRGVAAFKSQWMGVDPETGELGEAGFHNLISSIKGEPRSKRRSLGIVDNTLAMGTLPSDLAPMLAPILRKLNPISSTASKKDDEIRPPSIDQLAQGTELGNAYSEADPGDDPDMLDELLNFAPPQWAEEAAIRASRTKTLANQSMGLQDNPEDLADAAVDAGVSMGSQLPVPGPWLRRLRGIRAAAESKTATGALRSALGAPAEYLSPTVDPSLRNYASGTAYGAISNYLGADGPAEEEQVSQPATEPQGYSVGGLINRATLQIAGPILQSYNEQRAAQGLPLATSFDPRGFFDRNSGIQFDQRFGFNNQPAPINGGPTGMPVFANTTATPRNQTIPTGSGQTGFVPQPNQIPQQQSDAARQQALLDQLNGEFSFGNDVIQPTTAINVRTGEVINVGQGSTPAAQGNPQFLQPLQRGQAPPRPAPVNLPTQGAGIYGPMAGSTAPPRRISNPSDPQWWLTYGFGPEQNFYASNSLPSSGVPGGG